MLTVLPAKEFGFALRKGCTFPSLRLGNLYAPQLHAHVAPTSQEHALSCVKGGYPIIRHTDQGFHCLPHV